jgi:hypothetical protein
LYEGGKGMDKNPLLRKVLAVGIILLFVGTSVIPSTAQDRGKPFLPTSNGHWLYVGGSGPGNYSSITAALQNASDNDTIYVYSGVYSKNNVLINISVSLIGQSNISTIIDNSTFDFNASNIFLTGFCFQNQSLITIDSVFGNNVNHNTITNTLFTNGSLGLGITNSNFNTIRNNRFDACGISLSPPYSFTDEFTNTIINNIVNGKPLVYLENVTDRSISNAGQIILLRCRNITISQMSFEVGTPDLQFIQTTNTTIRNNDFRDTLLFFTNSSENTIAGNQFYTQVKDKIQLNGLLLYDKSNNNEIVNNVFWHFCLILFLDSYFNLIKQNDFYGLLPLYRPLVTFMDAENTWQRNYWMRPRILPKLIGGYNTTHDFKRSFEVDWRPALLPKNPIPHWGHNEMYLQQKTQQSCIQLDKFLPKYLNIS